MRQRRAVSAPGSRAAAGLDSIELAGTGQFDLTAADGSTYRILVAIPDAPAPEAGYPSLVLVDGHALFATAVTTARLQSSRPEVTGVAPGVLIGIGYPGEAPFDSERRARDLLPVEGGAARFAATIVDEILPAVGRLAPLDRGRCALAGHSYGGLFALHTLFTRPDAFDGFIAGSPSIWWNDRAILGDEARFLATEGPPPRLLLTVGGSEQSGTPDESAQRTARRAMARMCDNAGEMAARLSASGRLACEFLAFPGENHVSVIPAMLSRAVSFGFAGHRRSDR